MLERIAARDRPGDPRPFAPPAGTSEVKFPVMPYRSAASYLAGYVEESIWAASSIEPTALDHAAAILLDAYTRGAGVFSCGNGGSAAISNHLQCDHMKGVRTTTDPPPRGVSSSSNI